MVLLNDYFHAGSKADKGSISVSGKLEAFIGNYFVSGEGMPDTKLLLIYYDPKIDSLYCWSRAEIATQSRIEITNLGRLEIANAAADSFL